MSKAEEIAGGLSETEKLAVDLRAMDAYTVRSVIDKGIWPPYHKDETG